MEILLTTTIYVMSLSALALLAWWNPRRLRIAKLETHYPPITGVLRMVLIGIVVLPVTFAIWHNDWAAMCIAAGLLMGWGWGLGLLLAVQREEQCD